jgi:hypothetical protein
MTSGAGRKKDSALTLLSSVGRAEKILTCGLGLSDVGLRGAMVTPGQMSCSVDQPERSNERSMDEGDERSASERCGWRDVRVREMSLARWRPRKKPADHARLALGAATAATALFRVSDVYVRGGVPWVPESIVAVGAF